VRQFGPTGQLIGAGTFGAFGFATFIALKIRREKAAFDDVNLEISRMEEPTQIDPQLVQNISDKFGINLSEKFSTQLRSIYDSYISNILPMDKPLIGNEADLIKRFKCSLSISDEEAAIVHIEIGRRINRLRSEAGCRIDSARITKFLHRFIYVSAQVFGDTAFLLNWKRHLGISDAQLLVAKRNCATQLFKDKLSAYGEAGPHPYEEVFKELCVEVLF
jgi:hypothetical protein